MLIGNPSLVAAKDVMKNAGMSSIDMARVIQGIHAWATGDENFRLQQVVQQNPPRFPTIKEIQEQLIDQ